jgi:hypothetical protein
MSCLIRMATRVDISSVASVLLQSFLENEASYTREAFAATISTSTELEHRLVEGPVWIAVENETVVGTVSVPPATSPFRSPKSQSNAICTPESRISQAGTKRVRFW